MPNRAQLEGGRAGIESSLTREPSSLSCAVCNCRCGIGCLAGLASSTSQAELGGRQLNDNFRTELLTFSSQSCVRTTSRFLIGLMILKLSARLHPHTLFLCVEAYVGFFSPEMGVHIHSSDSQTHL